MTDGRKLLDSIMDTIRYEAENSDSLQGFQICHSIGGGTGSGLSSLLLSTLKDHYPRTMTQSFTVFPSPKVSDVKVEPYNATLSIPHLINNCDNTFVIDNEAVYNISHNVLKIDKPKYADMNYPIGQVMSTATTPFRYPTQYEYCGTMKRMYLNLIPFPRLHFMTLGQAPLFPVGQGLKIKARKDDLAPQLWGHRNW